MGPSTPRQKDVNTIPRCIIYRLAKVVKSSQACGLINLVGYNHQQQDFWSHARPSQLISISISLFSPCLSSPSVYLSVNKYSSLDLSLRWQREMAYLASHTLPYLLRVSSPPPPGKKKRRKRERRNRACRNGLYYTMGYCPCRKK